jgi:C-terminal processing protease CtpA/Prc
MNIMKKIIFLLSILIALSYSCKKETVEPVDTLTADMARDSLYYIMKDWYYWYDKPEATSVTGTSKENFDDPYNLLEAMRYKELDRWSFVADYDEFIAEMQGTFVGHGFRIGVDPAGKARISMIYDKSALYSEGVRRGWIVKTINGTAIAPILIAGDAAEYTRVIGPSKAGITNIFVFTKPDGTDVTISSTKSTFTQNTVLLSETLELSSGPTGHIVFESFITPSSAELKKAFLEFKTNGIKDLILDLRYNSGGYLYIAQELASYIGGDKLEGSLFAKLQYNNQHPVMENSSFLFLKTSYSLTLPRIVVITTRSTASASEAVMNGLKPFATVISVGDTTNGKPAGMNGWDVGQKYFIWPITFKMVNAMDQGEYFEGIAPDKLAPDDITRDFNDKEELSLKEAIKYLETGSLSKGATVKFRSHAQFHEKPAWMNNAFVIE